LALAEAEVRAVAAADSETEEATKAAAAVVEEEVAEWTVVAMVEVGRLRKVRGCRWQSSRVLWRGQHDPSSQSGWRAAT
jgi:hypothetical protein